MTTEETAKYRIITDPEGFRTQENLSFFSGCIVWSPGVVYSTLEEARERIRELKEKENFVPTVIEYGR